MCVMKKSSFPLSDLALKGVAHRSEPRPSSLTKPLSIKLFSSPESLSASSSVVVWCITSTFVSVHNTGPEAMTRLTARDILAGQGTTRWPVSSQKKHLLSSYCLLHSSCVSHALPSCMGSPSSSAEKWWRCSSNGGQPVSLASVTAGISLLLWLLRCRRSCPSLLSSRLRAHCPEGREDLELGLPAPSGTHRREQWSSTHSLSTKCGSRWSSRRWSRCLFPACSAPALPPCRLLPGQKSSLPENQWESCRWMSPHLILPRLWLSRSGEKSWMLSLTGQ